MLTNLITILPHSTETQGTWIEIAGDIAFDALLDTLMMLPFLLIMFFIIEYLEHRATQKALKLFGGSSRLGPVVGAVFGVIPQCGFSVLSSGFYSNRLITLGTLLAVYLSTSDEAFLIILSHPELISEGLILLLVKLIYAIAIGYLVDAVFKKQAKSTLRTVNVQEEHLAHCHEGCGCSCDSKGSMFKNVLKHTFTVIIWIAAANLVLNTLITLVGEATLEKFMLTNNMLLQPVVSAIIGLIPNCAASVILSDLYVEGFLSIGALLSGLCAAAGIGIVVLFRSNKKLSNSVFVLALLYVFSVILGVGANLILSLM